MIRLLALLLLLVLAPATALAKRITVHGIVMVSNGKPAAHAQIIVKDSWAGLLVMRERVLARVQTDADGRFMVEEIRYHHTLDFLVIDKDCEWMTGNKRVTESDRAADGIYRPRFILLFDDSCERRASAHH